jgi:hypothetical protein
LRQHLKHLWFLTFLGNSVIMLPPFPLIVRTYRLVNPVLLKLGAPFALGEVVEAGAAPVVMYLVGDVF